MHLIAPDSLDAAIQNQRLLNCQLLSFTQDNGAVIELADCVTDDLRQEVNSVQQVRGHALQMRQYRMLVGR